MTKVWILEKWNTLEDVAKSIESYKELRESILSSEQNEDEKMKMSAICLELIYKAEERTEGYWSGFEGKQKYKDFLITAGAAIRRNKNGYKFRVVTAMIEDGANMWTGYKDPVANEGVMNYLLAVNK